MRSRAVGTIVLGAVFGGTALCLLACWLVARRAEAREQPLPRGLFRLAAARGDVATVDLLWWHVGPAKLGGAEAALPDGWTALHVACSNGQARAALWLAQRDANVAAIENDGWKQTALHLAAASGGVVGRPWDE